MTDRDPPEDPPVPPPASDAPVEGEAGSAADSSGSIDVAFSGQLPEAGTSGSVDVRITEPEGKPGTAAGKRKRARTIPVAVVEAVSATVVHAADKIGDKVVAASDSITEKVSESLQALPVVPRSRRGRVMARSVVLSFLLVFSWIAVIVGLQLRHPRPPDFRPLAEKVLADISNGKAVEVYRDASIRFQEVVLEETFVEQMDDMNKTLGTFREISAVLVTEVNRGPGGRTGRIDVRIEYSTGPTKGSVGFRWEGGRWKMLGIFVDVPKELAAAAGSEAKRQARVKGNEDELRAVAQTILEHSARGEIDQIWNDAALGFQQSISLPNFRQIEEDRRAVLGPYKRILHVTSARQNPSRTGASLQLLIEFEKATITGSFEFTKIQDAWKLTFFKLVLPLPRVPE
jgi:hypothetical protein